MSKYTGGWSANNGSSYNDNYQSNNKRKLAHDMRLIAQGNCHAGSTGRWYVDYADVEMRKHEHIMSGTVRN